MLLFASFRFRSCWTVLFLLGSAGIVVSLWAYFDNDRTATFLLEKGPLRHDAFWQTAFYLHLVSSTVCLLSGPALMFRRLIRHRRFHRWIGYLHLNSVLWMAAPTGLMLSVNAKGGVLSAIGFAITGMLWWLATWQGYRSARGCRYAEHAKWMIRSYSLALGAVWFRLLQIAMAYGIPILTGKETYVASVWLSLVASLLVAESSVIALFRQSEKAVEHQRHGDQRPADSVSGEALTSLSVSVSPSVEVLS
ncbi:DUF2306 domain-containing protein [Roseiconus lacunae]|uniref:DUF2306 domain-containing protein n=1 Tax=Roseiconus lacunae TaxID=2605694 RepID=UPI001E3ACC2B|nr:DUF2306 domain-containing protein [Roseiconus lacunae]MCD0463131.1 DUF2306 domain-containing protein [Roseiconus lacunae]